MGLPRAKSDSLECHNHDVLELDSTLTTCSPLYGIGVYGHGFASLSNHEIRRIGLLGSTYLKKPLQALRHLGYKLVTCDLVGRLSPIQRTNLQRSVSHNVKGTVLRCYLIRPGFVPRPLHIHPVTNTPQGLYTTLTSIRRLIVEEHP